MGRVCRGSVFLLAAGLAFAAEPPVCRFWKASDGLAETFVRSISVDSKGEVLVRHGCVTRMERLDGYGIFPLPQPSYPHTIYGTPSGQLWTLTEAGLWEFSDGKWLLRGGITPPQSPIAALPIGDNRVLILGSDRLVEYDAAWGVTRTVLAATATGLGQFRQMSPAANGTVWVSGEKGFGKFCALGERPWTEYAQVMKPIKSGDLVRAISGVLAPTPAETAPPAERETRPRREGPRMRILVCEDNAVNQKLARRVLELEGHEVQVAGDGKEGLDLLASHEFDLIFMDVQMPNMDGLEATAAIRAMEKARGDGRHVPILAMTAHAMKGDREGCLAAGMDGYVGKPARASEIYEAIETVLAASRRS